MKSQQKQLLLAEKNSVASRCSLSLKKSNSFFNINKNPPKIPPHHKVNNKENKTNNQKSPPISNAKVVCNNNNITSKSKEQFDDLINDLRSVGDNRNSHSLRFEEIIETQISTTCDNNNITSKSKQQFAVNKNNTIPQEAPILSRDKTIEDCISIGLSPIDDLINERSVGENRKSRSMSCEDIIETQISTTRHNNNITSKSKQQFAVNKNNTIPQEAPILSREKTVEDCISIGLSPIDDLIHERSVGENRKSRSMSFEETIIETPNHDNIENSVEIVNDCNVSLITISSATDLEKTNCDSTSTVSYSLGKPAVLISFGIMDCDDVQVSTNKSNIKKISLSRKNNETNVECEVIEGSEISQHKSESEESDKPKEILPSPPKKMAVAVNLEIKKKSAEDNATSLKTEEKSNSKVLILNTNDIARLSHVIVQPPNYNLVKRQIPDKRKLINSAKKKRVLSTQDARRVSGLKQSRIDSYLVKKSDVVKSCVDDSWSEDISDVGEVMNRNLNSSKCDHHRAPSRGRKESDVAPHTTRPLPKRSESPRQPQQLKAPSADSQRVQSAGAASPRKNVDSLQFSLPAKTRSNRTAISPRAVPPFKIVTGTHFAVDAFSYGEIPYVKHYFLTHFHSDHYAGLKKSFNKFVFCSKITAELCVSRLGVNPKCIRIINCDETIMVDNVEVTAVDANHCPGALMLIFTLPSGKTVLHTGDFRASPYMESYPIFWNKDIHTIYLDTTYCNPRYDFPTQDQSLEMALYILRQKKLALEKAGKKFSQVLIVCGTYTIGKEKFFLGMARRVGCSVWACPEKDRVLQAVEGRSFGNAPPHACQLHVVPMRDLTHEKLHTYLMGLQNAFLEVVAFKPSGWENGKNTSVEKECVTIHGIPYSEHSSFSEMIRFVKYLKPKQVVPTVDISGGVKAVQKFFPCPLVVKDGLETQSKLTEYFSLQGQQDTAVT